MRSLKTIQATKNFQLNICEFWSTQVNSLVRCYGIANINTGVFEYGPGQSLIEAEGALQMLEAETYPVDGSEKPEPEQPLLQ